MLKLNISDQEKEVNKFINKVFPGGTHNTSIIQNIMPPSLEKSLQQSIDGGTLTEKLNKLTSQVEDIPSMTKGYLNDVMQRNLKGIDGFDSISKVINGLDDHQVKVLNARVSLTMLSPLSNLVCSLMDLFNRDFNFRDGLGLAGILSLAYDSCQKRIFDAVMDTDIPDDTARFMSGYGVIISSRDPVKVISGKQTNLAIDASNHAKASKIDRRIPGVSHSLASLFSPGETSTPEVLDKYIDGIINTSGETIAVKNGSIKVPIPKYSSEFKKKAATPSKPIDTDKLLTDPSEVSTIETKSLIKLHATLLKPLSSRPNMSSVYG